ncbi:hypothetical protein V9T40_007739 [Parthenolecanium corni]|uniref:CHK kinase-like domain-containing protein n=1 Tax=Parthenolecanium corni TaxID=536013 RepID=A0AAN9TLV9_9HEMI
MESFVGNLAESFFNEHRETFGEEAIFVRFALGERGLKVSVAEFSYTIAAGTVFYRESAQASAHSSANLLIKYFDAGESELLPGFASFAQEIHFLQATLPFFDAVKPIRHLFLPFCASGAIATQSTNRSAILFEWPHKADLGKAVPLGYSRGSLLMKRIAELHASSLLLQRSDALLFDNLNCTFLEQAQLDAQLVLPTLRSCLQPLYEDPRYEDQYDQHFHNGVLRLAFMLDDFAHRLNIPFVRANASDRCWVLCHQNYCQESVVFEQAGDQSHEDVKIFNSQMTGFASLGVDLVVPLLVELESDCRSRHLHQLVNEYRDELHIHCAGPTLDSILSEIQKCVPFALYMLASRVMWVQSEAESMTKSLFERNVWTESLVTALFKYLIDFNCV